MRQWHMRLISVPPKHPDKKVTREISSIASPCGDSELSMSSAAETPPTACRVLTFNDQAEQSSVNPPAAKCTPVSGSALFNVLNMYRFFFVCVCVHVHTCVHVHARGAPAVWLATTLCASLVGRVRGCVSPTGDHAPCGSSRWWVKGVCVWPYTMLSAGLVVGVSPTGDHALCQSSRRRVRGWTSNQRPCFVRV